MPKLRVSFEASAIGALAEILPKASDGHAAWFVHDPRSALDESILVACEAVTSTPVGLIGSMTSAALADLEGNRVVVLCVMSDMSHGERDDALERIRCLPDEVGVILVGASPDVPFAFDAILADSSCSGLWWWGNRRVTVETLRYNLLRAIVSDGPT